MRSKRVECLLAHAVAELVDEDLRELSASGRSCRERPRHLRRLGEVRRDLEQEEARRPRGVRRRADAGDDLALRALVRLEVTGGERAELLHRGDVGPGAARPRGTRNTPPRAAAGARRSRRRAPDRRKPSNARCTSPDAARGGRGSPARSRSRGRRFSSSERCVDSSARARAREVGEARPRREVHRAVVRRRELPPARRRERRGAAQGVEERFVDGAGERWS